MAKSGNSLMDVPCLLFFTFLLIHTLPLYSRSNKKREKQFNRFPVVEAGIELKLPPQWYPQHVDEEGSVAIYTSIHDLSTIRVFTIPFQITITEKDAADLSQQFVESIGEIYQGFSVEKVEFKTGIKGNIFIIGRWQKKKIPIMIFAGLIPVRAKTSIVILTSQKKGKKFHLLYQKIKTAISIIDAPIEIKHSSFIKLKEAEVEFSFRLPDGWRSMLEEERANIVKLFESEGYFSKASGIGKQLIFFKPAIEPIPPSLTVLQLNFSMTSGKETIHLLKRVLANYDGGLTETLYNEKSDLRVISLGSQKLHCVSTTVVRKSYLVPVGKITYLVTFLLPEQDDNEIENDVEQIVSSFIVTGSSSEYSGTPTEVKNSRNLRRTANKIDLIAGIFLLLLIAVVAVASLIRKAKSHG